MLLPTGKAQRIACRRETQNRKAWGFPQVGARSSPSMAAGDFKESFMSLIREMIKTYGGNNASRVKIRQMQQVRLLSHSLWVLCLQSEQRQKISASVFSLSEKSDPDFSDGAPAAGPLPGAKGHNMKSLRSQAFHTAGYSSGGGGGLAPLALPRGAVSVPRRPFLTVCSGSPKGGSRCVYPPR